MRIHFNLHPPVTVHFEHGLSHKFRQPPEMTIHFNLHPPVTIHFEHGLGQKFREALGIGINFSMFEDTELLKVADLDICLIVVKAEASHPAHDLDIYPIFAKLIYLNQLEFGLLFLRQCMCVTSSRDYKQTTALFVDNQLRDAYNVGGRVS
ncbi:hypothetical protein DVH24_000261 [Malus domestica]|uniref:RING-type E3 ubiquitin transferase n=1 Tax=Malus domestica TaxID=3750 RepID=A0A498J417_MALDO|nr:hypothetical protein DVH24_000261 [Malus domestica]